MIDSHCHLNSKSLADNIENIILNSKKNKVTSILSINTNPLEFLQHLKLINRYKGIYISYGLHPCEVNNNDQITMSDFDNHCKKNRVVGIGETGLDYYHSKEFVNEQIKCFELHIEAAIKYDLPLIIHQRDSEKDIIEILQSYTDSNLKVVFHCFAGSKKLLEFSLRNQFYISLSGIVTFKNADILRNLIKDYPLNLILLETDSPFLAPVPVRGKKNEPSYIKHTAEFLSNFYKKDFDEFINITDNNFFKLFNKTKKDNYL